MNINKEFVEKLLSEINSFTPEEGWLKIHSPLSTIIDEIEAAQLKDKKLQNDIYYSDCLTKLMEIKDEYLQSIADKRRAYIKAKSAKKRGQEFYNYYIETVGNILYYVKELFIQLK